MEVEERLPSLMLLHGSLGDAGAAGGEEEELTAVLAPGLLSQLPFLRVGEGNTKAQSQDQGSKPRLPTVAPLLASVMPPPLSSHCESPGYLPLL